MHGARSTWLLAAPLIAASSVVAHALAYRLAGGNAGTAADDTHHYLTHLPLLAAPAVAAALAALTVRAVRARRGERPPALPWAPFALAPALGFALQELVEHAAAHQAQSAVSGPTFAAGVALAVPVGLAALLVAQALLAAADRTAAFPAEPPDWLAPPSPLGPVCASPRAPSVAASARRATGRGPPLRLAV